MVIYSSDDILSSGVPLGGIGAGKIEINNKGKLINVTIFNNKGFPIRSVRGFHILIKPNDGKPFFLEKELPFINFKDLEADKLSYEGLYPFTYIIGNKDGISAKLTAFSPIIPKNLRDSTLPAVGFSISVEGSKSGIIAFSFPNIVGTNPIGRINKSEGNKLILRNIRSIDIDPRKSEIVLLGDENLENMVTQYNINVKPEIALNKKVWNNRYESEDVWEAIIRNTKFNDNVHEVSGLWDDPAGILISKYENNEQVKFVLSWYVYGKHVYYPYGTYYQRNFSSAVEISEYFYKEFDRLRKQTLEFHEMIKSDLPSWLRDAIINSSYILSSNTILDDNERFGIYEAPEVCPCVGTIAALCHEGGSLPLLFLFPELEKNFLRILSNKIREDGYVPHDLGIHSLDHTVDGTTAPPKWKDTNPTFILLVYRYYKFTGDIEFLREMYPKMVKAMKWELTQDRDGDGVPELEGQGDTGFDAMSVKGIDSYTTSIYIASILALRESSKIIKDQDIFNQMEELLKKARSVYLSLFNGKYFDPWHGEPRVQGIFLGQLIGQWWTEILGLENIIDEEKITSALDSMLNNTKASEYCTPNLVSEDGKIIDISPQAYSSWPRLVFAISAIGYKRRKDWLEVTSKEWNNLVKHGIVWNQPSRINGFNGNPDPEIYLDHYIGNSTLWTFTL